MNDHAIQALAFDLDGTLIDSLPGIEFSVNAALGECDVPRNKVDLRSIIGPPIRVILSKLADPCQVDLDRLEDAFRRSYDSEGWSKTKLYPGAQAVLEELQDAGIRLFVITNKPRHISMRILDWAQIGHRFERVIARDSCIPDYPNKRAMLDDLQSSCGVDISHWLLVGDTEEDAKAAAECGMKFGHMAYGYGTISETSSFPMCFRTSDLSGLLEWIQLESAHDR